MLLGIKVHTFGEKTKGYGFMKTVLVKSDAYVCDECSAGKPMDKKISSQIFLAGAYCRKQGLDVDVLFLPSGQSYSFNQYDVVVAWVPLLEGFYEEIKYLEKAKHDGKITVMILNDPFEELEKEALSHYKFIDFCVRLYEREIVLAELLEKIKSGNSYDWGKNAGIILRKESGIIDYGKKPALRSLEHLVSADKLLRQIDLRQYKEVFIEVARGCPFKCGFCFYRCTGHRKRKIEDVMSELAVVAGKIDIICLHDLDFLAEKKWAEQLCDAIIDLGINVTWTTDVRIDQCDDVKLLKKLKSAGCVLVNLGIESGTNEILEKIHKGIRIEMIDGTLRNCQEAGIKTEVNFMIGYPWDSHASLNETFKLIKKYDTKSIQIFRPLRGSVLYEECRKLNLLKRELGIDDYVHVRSSNWFESKPLCPTLYLSNKEIIKWQKKLQRFVYLRIQKQLISKNGIWRYLCDFIKDKSNKGITVKKVIKYFKNIMGL